MQSLKTKKEGIKNFCSQCGRGIKNDVCVVHARVEPVDGEKAEQIHFKYFNEKYSELSKVTIATAIGEAYREGFTNEALKKVDKKLASKAVQVFVEDIIGR